MKKFLLSGILGLACFIAQGQSWKDFYDSTSYFWAQDWPKTISLLLKAKDQASATISTDHPAYYSIIEDLGVAYWKNQDFESAGKFLTASILHKPHTASTPHSTELIKTLTHFAQWQMQSGNKTDGFATLRWIVFNKNRTEDPLLYFSAADNLIELYEKAGAYDSALNVCEFVSKGRTKISSKADWNVTVARINYKAGNHGVALKMLQNNLKKIKKSTGHADDEIKTYLLLGEIQLQSGDKFNGLKNLLNAKDIANNPGVYHEALRVNVYKRLVNAYESEKDYANAYKICDEFIKDAPKNNHGNSFELAEIINEKADLYFNQGNYKEAIEQYENLLTVYPKYIKESDPVFVDLLNNLARAYKETDQLHRAYVYLRWAYEMINTRESYKSDLAVNVITNLAEVYASKGDPAQAEQHLQEARSIKSSAH